MSLGVYRGYSSQYGAGLGNVLGGVIRAAIPHVAPILKKAGMSAIDYGLRKRNVPVVGGLVRQLGRRAVEAGVSTLARKARQALPRFEEDYDYDDDDGGYGPPRRGRKRARASPPGNRRLKRPRATRGRSVGVRAGQGTRRTPQRKRRAIDALS